MPYSVKDIKEVYPLPVYNYRVEISNGATTETIAFSNVSGLSLSFETHTYKESPDDSNKGDFAGPIVRRMPAQRADVKITLKKGLVRTKSIKALYGWINSVQVNQVEKKDITVRLLDEAGAPVVSWKVINAFPTKLDAPAFDATSNDVAIESMELTADIVMMEESATAGSGAA